MTLRINHNISAINAHRSLEVNDHDLSKSLRRLSSGLAINHAADGPASLVISEQMRAQVAGLNQAINNSETAISLVQTAEGAFHELNSMLIQMRQLAIHAANEGVNDQVMLQADQQEIDNIIAAMDRIAKQTQFGARRLLDGSNGANGTATGNDLEFVRASTATNESKGGSYDVTITQNASRSYVQGTTALDMDMVKAGESLTIIEGGKSVTYKTREEDTVDTAVQNLVAAVERAELKVNVTVDESGHIRIEHTDYGKKPEFQVSSTTAGVLSQQAGIIEQSTDGLDIAGMLNGEAANGVGQILTGQAGAQNVDGLVVRYSGIAGDGALPNEGVKVGSVYVSQNSLTFQIGGNRGQHVGISLFETSADNLAKGIKNKSGFRRLSDVSVLDSEMAQDTLLMIDRAVNEITTIRAELGAFQKNTLEGNLNNLRIATENLTAAESIIRDVDMAAEMATFTRNQIMTESATAMLAQANQVPKAVLKLLN
ncbi:MAG: flagellin [Deltaproteobacteria bacterium]|nr:flagellin [Deltaproteobacteria bacterium]